MKKGTIQKILVQQNVQGGMTAEEKNEEAKRWAEQNDLLVKIEKNTAIMADKLGKGGGKDEETDGPSLGGLGLLATAAAAALGTIVGVVTAWAKTVKFFAKMLTPEWLKNGILQKIENFGKALSEIFQKGKAAVSNAVTRIGAFFAESFGKLKSFLKIGDEASFIGKVMSSIRNFFSSIGSAFKTIQEFSKPVREAVSWIQNGVSKLFSFFSGLGSKLGAFSKVFGAVSKIVSKIAYPLLIVMTVWDTVKGFIEGFEKDGIIGGIMGAVKGFFNSLIMAPLDMLKDAVSWILDVFGFDNASKWLDSFSFEDLFTGFIDGFTDMLKSVPEYLMKALTWVSESFSKLLNEYIIDPLAKIFSPVKDFFKNLKDTILGFFENFSIPEIGFTIPIINEKVSIGPFYPFRSDESQAERAASGQDKQAAEVGRRELGGGEMRIDREDGSYDMQGAYGVKKYNSKGELTSQVDPQFAGVRTERFADGSVRTQYNQGPMKIDQATDTKGNQVYNKADYDLGIARVSRTESRGSVGIDAKTEMVSVESEAEAYNNPLLTWFDRRKVDVGYAKASEILIERMAEQSMLNNVSKSSASVSSSSRGSMVVNAPVTTNNTTNVSAPRSPIRNYDPSARNTNAARHSMVRDF